MWNSVAHRPAGVCFAIFALVLLVAACGCQKSSYELATVHGSVSVGNQPLAQGKVMFAPVADASVAEAGKAAVGLIQSDGSFSLSTFGEGDGAIVGEHWVTVFVPKQSQPVAAGLPEAAAADIEYKRVAVPTKQIVHAGKENQIEIKL